MGKQIVDGSVLSYSFNKTVLAAYSDFSFMVSARTAPGMGESSIVFNGSCITNAAGKTTSSDDIQLMFIFKISICYIPKAVYS